MHLRWLFLALTAWWMLAGCGEEAEPLPIEKTKLKAILVDVHVAEAALSNLYGPVRDSMATIYYEEICTIHEISRSELDTTLERLRRDPDLLYKTYEEVMEALEMRK